MIRELVPKRIRKTLYRMLFPGSPVLWANCGILSKYLAAHIPPKTPPVVILSMPRSGSSWVGEIMGLSHSSLYLREPLTQTFITTRQTGPSFFELDEDNLPKTYRSSAENVFAGLPLFNTQITRQPKQWGLTKRKHKRVVIKEINPFILDWLIKNFHPRIIYLIRHPAAVADSFNRLGYNGKQLESRFTQETLNQYDNYERWTHSFWADHGAMQAIVLKEVMNKIRGYKDFQLIQYEHLCQNPMSTFRELYDFAELQWTDTVVHHISKRSQPQTVDTHDFSTQRNSIYEMAKWKKQLSPDQIQQIKEAWLSFDPPFYGLSEW